MNTTNRVRVLRMITFGLLLASVGRTDAGVPSTIFDFQHSGPTGFTDFVTRTQDGFSVSIYPLTSTAPDGTLNPTWSTVLGTGLGVYTGTSGLGVQAYSGDSNDIDGSNLDESAVQMEGLRITFGSAVRLESVYFAGMGSSDDFNLTVDGTLKLLDVATNPLDLTELRDSWFPVVRTGTEFIIWADGISDDFRVAKFEVSAVPEPTSLALMVTALMTVGAFRRLRAR